MKTTEEANARLDICKTCSWLQKPLNRCRKCGCFMDVKVYLEGAECPIGKW